MPPLHLLLCPSPSLIFPPRPLLSSPFLSSSQLHYLQEAVALPATRITALGRKQLKQQLRCSPLSIPGDLLMLGFEMMCIAEGGGRGLSAWLPVAMQAKRSQPVCPVPALVQAPSPQHEK